MKSIAVAGIQKLTLLDYPEHTACTVFLKGCDFRCPYCHNFALAEGKGDVIDEKEIFRFLSGRKGLLDGVVVTGGEPCIQKALPGFLSKIKEMGFLVKLDTNGAHPDMLSDIINKGLVDYIAMDVKNSPKKYKETSGNESLDISKIKQSISLIMNSGLNYEFRTTVVDEFHEEEDFYGIGQIINGAKKYFLQPFVNRESVVTQNLHSPSISNLEKYAEITRRYIENVQIRGI